MARKTIGAPGRISRTLLASTMALLSVPFVANAATSAGQQQITSQPAANDTPPMTPVQHHHEWTAADFANARDTDADSTPTAAAAPRELPDIPSTNPPLATLTAGEGKQLYAPAQPSLPADPNQPTATSGKLFYTEADGSKGRCSASVVNSPHKNMVITAAHCLWKHRHQKFGTDYVFVPAYSDGKAPYGKWKGTNIWVHDNWTKKKDPNFDQGFIRVEKTDGHELVERVGGNGVAIGAKPTESVRIIGYSFNAPAGGERKGVCNGKPVAHKGKRSLGVPCYLSYAGSGGPWLMKADPKTDLGVLFAVISSADKIDGKRCTTSEPFHPEVEQFLRKEG